MPSLSRDPRVTTGASLAPLGVALGLYLAVFSTEWALNDQYGYGYFVPLIAGYLLFLRWQDRPPAAGMPRRGWLWGAVAAVVALLPVRVVLLANPDWRAAQWALALCLYAVALCTIGTWGGRRWVRHFAVAVGVLLLAVPWPYAVETALVQGLMQWVAATTVELLNLMGIFAERHGNIIRVASGLVGVEEACSGVRSLQATLMTAVFLGELFAFRWAARAGLVALGAGVSLLLNIVRTLSLTLVAADRGGAFMQHIHDPVGNIVAVVAFVVLFAVAWGGDRWMRGRRHRHREPVEGTRFEPSWLPVPQGAGLAVALLAVLGIARLWFVNGGGGPAQVVQMDWQRVAPGIHEAPIPQATRALLRYSEGTRREWTERGWPCTAFLFTWDAGLISSFAGVHSPEVCLPSAGFKRVGEGPPLEVRPGGRPVRLQALAFSDGATLHYVYFGVWDTVAGEPVPVATTARERLHNAWEGHRVTGRQSLQVVVSGAPGFNAAADVVARMVEAGTGRK